MELKAFLITTIWTDEPKYLFKAKILQRMVFYLASITQNINYKESFSQANLCIELCVYACVRAWVSASFSFHYRLLFSRSWPMAGDRAILFEDFKWSNEHARYSDCIEPTASPIQSPPWARGIEKRPHEGKWKLSRKPHCLFIGFSLPGKYFLALY